MEDRPNPDGDLTEFLRQGAGRDWAEEAAEDEGLTETMRQRRMDLFSVAEDAAHRGERATAEMGETVLSGSIMTTGTDYLTIQLPEQEADVRLDSAIWSFVPNDREAPTSTNSEMSFVGLLKEHSNSGRRVRLEMTGGGAVMGVIDTVSQDHIRVKDPDGRIAYVPITGVKAIIRSSSQH